MPAAVDSQVLVGLVAELLELLLVGAIDPARGPDVDRLVGALDLVFLLQAAGDHVELQYPDRAEDNVVVALGEEHLGCAFLGQFLQTLAQLLGFQRVLQAHTAEQFRGEVRNAGETHVLAGGEGVADLDGAVVVQADDVAAEGFFQLLAVAGEEGQRVADLDVLADAHMAHLHALLVFAGAHPHKGDAVAMARVHVRLDLEHEAAERRLGRPHLALLGHARQRGGRPVDEGVQHMADAEVAQRGTEEHRGHLALQVFLEVELVTGPLDQFQFLHEAVVQVAQQGAGLVAVQALDDALFGALVAVARRIDVNAVVGQMIDTLEIAVAADRPGDGRGLDAQHLFDLVEQLDGVADIAVEFVDEADDRRVAQTADIHQGDGAWLHTLAAVDHHQRAVHRGEGAVGVFGEVLVAGGVEQVDHVLAVGELHHRGGDGNPALLLHGHPVGSGVAVGFARFHRAGDFDGLAHQQQALGDGGLARVGVGNDGEGTALRDFGGLCSHRN